jgi:hypothetical protein
LTGFLPLLLGHLLLSLLFKFQESKVEFSLMLGWGHGWQRLPKVLDVPDRMALNGWRLLQLYATPDVGKFLIWRIRLGELINALVLVRN